jgi:hypothetical protein
MIPWCTKEPSSTTLASLQPWDGPGCCTELTPCFWRWARGPTPDRSRMWGVLMAPALSTTSWWLLINFVKSPDICSSTPCTTLALLITTCWQKHNYLITEYSPVNLWWFLKFSCTGKFWVHPHTLIFEVKCMALCVLMLCNSEIFWRDIFPPSLLLKNKLSKKPTKVATCSCLFLAWVIFPLWRWRSYAPLKY